MGRFRRRAPRLLAVAMVLAVQGGCALLGGGDPPETPEEVVVRVASEDAIRTAIEARLAAEPAIGAGRIRAVVDGSEVQLHGVALGFGALQCAIANAELVPGVRLVIDMMVLQPGPTRVTCLAPRVVPVAPVIPLAPVVPVVPIVPADP